MSSAPSDELASGAALLSQNAPTPLHRNAGSMTCIPIELLARIFEHCLSADVFSTPSKTQAPLLLAHTCSHWRAVALSTPLLWSRLHVTYQDPLLDVDMTSNWLRRSGRLPLSISVSIAFNERPAQEFLDVICHHSARWKRIRFEFCGLYCPPMYSLTLATGNTPLLRALEFDARDISSVNISPVIALLNLAPKVREIIWVDDLADTRLLMELPLSQLSRLSITTSHGTLNYLELLDQCYNLEQIRITRPRPGDTRLPSVPLVLFKLTSLSITYDVTALLDSLILPALKHVRIYSEVLASRSMERYMGARRGATAEDEANGSWSPLSFLSLVQRSSCNIESLTLDTCMTETCLAQCLEVTRASLIKLTITGVTITDKLISSLTCSPPISLTSPSSSTPLDSFAHNSLCPLLQEICLNTRLISTTGALLKMTESRLISSSNTQITHFYLSVWDGHKDLESLKLLRGQYNPPGSSCNFKLEVLSPPKHVFSARSRTGKHLGAKRRLCQSR